jgi:hypothetical protein
MTPARAAVRKAGSAVDVQGRARGRFTIRKLRAN